MYRYVDVFKEMARSDTAKAVGRFDEVVASLARMFTAEDVDECERFTQLTGVHKKARAVDGPRSFNIPKIPCLGGEGSLLLSRGYGSVIQSVVRKMFCGRSRPRGAGFVGAK